MSESDEANLTGLVEYIARALVHDQDAVQVAAERAHGGGTIVKLHVAPDDMGRVIGKDGQIANSVRILLRVCGLNAHKRITLDID